MKKNKQKKQPFVTSQTDTSPRLVTTSHPPGVGSARWALFLSPSKNEDGPIKDQFQQEDKMFFVLLTTECCPIAYWDEKIKIWILI